MIAQTVIQAKDRVASAITRIQTIARNAHRTETIALQEALEDVISMDLSGVLSDLEYMEARL